MWTRISEPWQICLEEAWNAYCADSFPIGAAIANNNGEILASGRNQTRDNGSGRGMVRNHELAHAELNALLSFDSYKIDPTCALYALLEPCPLCFSAFYMSGMRHLHVAARDPLAGSVNLLNTTPYLKRKPIHIHLPEDNALETLVIALNIEYFLRAYRNPGKMLKSWREILPRGVELGEKLSHSGQLYSMSKEGYSVESMAEELGKMII